MKGGLDKAQSIVSFGRKEWAPKIKKTKKVKVQGSLGMDVESVFKTFTTLE